jgi:hypothetical protein
LDTTRCPSGFISIGIEEEFGTTSKLCYKINDLSFSSGTVFLAK